MWLTLWRKTFFDINYPLLLVWLKTNCLNKSKFFSEFALFKHGKKNILLSISVLVSEIVTFLTKKKSSLWISPKMLQKTERHSLAVCGSIYGEKHFMLIFIPFYWFDQKQLFKQIQMFLRICPFLTWQEKQTFWVFRCSFLR